jgi:hypothetical protein
METNAIAPTAMLWNMLIPLKDERTLALFYFS